MIISSAPDDEWPGRPDGADADALEAGLEAEQAEWRTLEVGPAQHGQRLDRVLTEQLAEFSRSYLQQRIEAGDVELEGRALVKPAAKVRLGQRLQVCLRPTPQSTAFVPEAMPIDTVYCDEHLRVVHKPAGLVVHPAPGHWRGTLLNGLLALDAQALTLPRAGIVHRLDKDTSGLMVVARTRAAMDALVQMIAAREVSRQYLAIGLRDWLRPPERVVDAALGRDPGNRLRMAVVDLARQPGKTARTTLECLDHNEQACLVRCTLHTGRTHQIRVHMAHVGHPLLGDPLYGGRPLAGLARQALHAWRLAFTHPFTGEALQWQRPLPEDMQAALASLGLRYNPDT